MLSKLLLAIAFCVTADAGYLYDKDLSAAGFIQWNPAEGGNGHWYKYVTTDPMPWVDAQSHAMSLGGQLATITSAQEQDFIKSLVPAKDFLWLGGYQNTSSPLYSEPAGGWQWVTDEPWEYTNWHLTGPAPPEPNEGEPGENFLSQHGDPILSWGWNDDRGLRNANYLVEISPSSIAVPEPGSLSVFAVCSATILMQVYRRRRCGRR